VGKEQPVPGPAPGLAIFRQNTCRASQTGQVILLVPPPDSVRAARGIYDRNGAPTRDGLVALAALEKGTADSVAAYRKEQLRKAWRTTRGSVVLLVVLSFLFISMAEESPGMYWTFFALTSLAFAAAVRAEWRQTRERIARNLAGSRKDQARTIETWKEIATMPDPEYARLLYRSQRQSALLKVAKPAAVIGLAAIKATVGGGDDLSEALNVLDYIDGSN
jgi:hypothetical protein